MTGDEAIAIRTLERAIAHMIDAVLAVRSAASFDRRIAENDYTGPLTDLQADLRLDIERIAAGEQ